MSSIITKEQFVNIKEALGTVLNYSQPVFTWKLDNTVAVICKSLPFENCRELATTNKTKYKDYKLFYIPSKIFSIDFNHRSTSIYGLYQYYDDVLVEPSVEQQKVMLRELITALSSMNLYPNSFTSPAAIFDKQVLQHMDLPTVADIPPLAAELAKQCGGRLWIEAFQLGNFKTCFDFDISSAFPTAMKELIDTRYCTWIEDAKYHPEAIYGYAQGTVTIFDNVKVSPIVKKAPDDSSFYPVGTWDTVLTKGEIDFIYKWNIGRVSIQNALWCIVGRKVAFPLPVVVDRLIKQKNDDNTLVRILAKKISVSLYGKFGEMYSNGNPGKHYNPVYFAEISTRIRLAVAEFIYQHKLQDNLIHVSVDGLLTDKLVSIQDSGNIKWKLSCALPALVLSAGLIWLGHKTRPKEVYLDDVLAMINDKPNTKHYNWTVERTVTLPESVNRNAPDLLGTIEQFQHGISFDGIEQGRKFKKLPKSGKQLCNHIYSSTPLKVGKAEKGNDRVQRTPAADSTGQRDRQDTV